MTTSEFLVEFANEPFTESTKAAVIALIGDASEITPELSLAIASLLEDELENDLKDITIDPVEVEKLTKQLETELLTIEQEASADEATMEQEVRELDDLSKKVDVLERLHTSK